jgi:hypothetical protein
MEFADRDSLVTTGTTPQDGEMLCVLMRYVRFD